jgi:peptide/nickel transport system permease protein
VTLLIFALLTQLSPSQRLALYVQDIERNPAATARLIEQYGLNDPAHEQYARWVGTLLQGDLGYSKIGKQPVTEVIKYNLPFTAELALWSIVPILVLGVQLGILAALRHNKPVDHILRIVSILGTSTPSFLFGLIVLLTFAARLRWLPTGSVLDNEYLRVVSGSEWNTFTHLLTVDALLNGRLDIFVNAMRHLIGPVMTLSYISLAILVRVTRGSMLEVLRQDYVRTARAKGLAERTVIQKHAVPNAMLPVATIGGGTLIGLMNGAAITETVFTRPGLGRIFVEAAANLDIITVLGLVLFSAAILVVGNLVVDLSYAYLDPRVRLS